MEYTYDNSEKNPRNPAHPPVEVTYGEQTTNEMLFGFLGVTSQHKPWELIRFRGAPPIKRGN